MAERWNTRRVVIRGPTGAEIPGEARIPDRSDDGPSFVVPAVILVITLALSLFVPPILLLNLPVLVLRAALTWWWGAKPATIWLRPFACPACDAPNPAADHPGELPITVACAECAASLVVERAPRRNLVAPTEPVSP